jgi:hypothetical protein
MSTSAAYPVHLELESPLEVANWRPLVAGLLAIPHFIVIYFLQIAASVVITIAWFAILFTGVYPRGMFDFVASAMSYQWRATSYALFLRESYPAFGLGNSEADYDPAELTVAYPENLSRGLIFVKWLLAVPHFIALCFVGIAAYVAIVVGFFAVLFTGRWPAGVRDFVLGFMRWSTRVQAYVNLMTDEYPPFSLA